jgi:hypothetical protein
VSTATIALAPSGVPGVLRVDQVAAEELVMAAHSTCPCSTATRGNIPVSVNVRTGERFQLVQVSRIQPD